MKRKFITAMISTAVITFIAVLGFILMLNDLHTKPIPDNVNSDNNISFEISDTESDAVGNSESEVSSAVLTSSSNESSETDTDTDSDTQNDTSDTDMVGSENDETDSDNEDHVVIPYDGVWEHILVNRWNSIPDDYTFEIFTLDNGKQIDQRIYEALQAMFDDARSQGVYPTVTEAYRSHEDQQAMMQSYIDEYIAQGYDEKTAKQMAEDYVAIPGTSEHEIGLALDINPDAEYSTVEDVYGWLADNAYMYGFILRYPEGKESITGINYEPWHYRYVGEEYALEIYESGMCLEEYRDFKQHEFLH